MIDLALYADDGPVLRRDISARQEISSAYVAQLFRRLCAAGLVRGVKGPGGGYALARDPATISVGDVVRAVEGPIAVAGCVVPDDPDCDRSADCVARVVWQRASQAMERVLDGVTLADLRDETRLQGTGLLTQSEETE
jgi:Rrf2 family protein